MPTTLKSNSCREAALEYLALGWSPIPLCPHDHKTTGKDGLPKGHADECKSPGKAPLWEWKQFQEHRCEENNIKYRWNCVPEANVGVCMGPVSGLVGLDIDGHEGIDLLTEWQGDNKMPDTLEFHTPGGGRRLLFQWPEGVEIHIKSFKGKNGTEAIRVLAKGSQTVMPPSIHHSGGRYAWVHGLSPSDIKPAPVPAAPIMHLTSMPRNPLAPDFGRRINKVEPKVLAALREQVKTPANHESRPVPRAGELF